MPRKRKQNNKDGKTTRVDTSGEGRGFIPTNLCISPTQNDNSPINWKEEEESSSDNFPSLGEPEKARVIYVASACNVCKAVEEPNSGLKLSSCAGCRMLKYCGRDHQLEDWKNHKQFCVAIQRILKAENRTHLYEGCLQHMDNQAQWLQIRFHSMQLLRDQLGRDLYAYEKEMLLFPLYICVTCSQAKLVPCNFCHHHHHHHHPEQQPQSDLSDGIDWCREFRLWLDLVRWECNHGLIKPSGFDEYVSEGGENEFSPDIRRYLKEQRVPGDIPRDLWTTVISEIATVPLSILWTILRSAPSLTQKETLTIHLIGAEMEFEGNVPSKWETCFMHHLKSLRTLHLVLIGPELLPGSSKPLLCQHCREQGRHVKVICESGILYHEYREEKGFSKPNIICAFNCGLYRKTGFNGEDTWAPTIPLLGYTDLLITTAYTETEVVQDTQRLLNECSGLKVHEKFRKNPYRSLRPQRTLINEDMEPLMYKNQYIATFSVEEALEDE